MGLISADQHALLRRATPARVWNAGLLWSSYHLSRLLKKPLVWGKPLSLSIEPTTACNLGCPECPSGLKQFTRPTGNLKTDFFRDILGQVKRHVGYMTFYFQGEPYIHPDFLALIREAHNAGVYTATSTNAHFLHPENARKTVESGLDRLIVSLDGSTQDTYEQYRIHGDLEKAKTGVRNVVAAREAAGSSSPHIILQCLVVRHNEHQIDDMLALGEELGVDEVRFKTAQVYDYKHGNDLIPKNAKYSRYCPLPDGTWAIRNKLLNQCWRMWQGAVITWDGLVVPCCFDKDATHRMGDLKSTPFNAIWKGETYRAFRAAILTSRSQIDICTNCTEGTKVWSEA